MDKPLTKFDRVHLLLPAFRLLSPAQLHILNQWGTDSLLGRDSGIDFSEAEMDLKTALMTVASLDNRDDPWPTLIAWVDSLPGDAWWSSVGRDEFIAVALELRDAGLAMEKIKDCLQRAYNAVANEYGG